MVSARFTGLDVLAQTVARLRGVARRLSVVGSHPPTVQPLMVALPSPTEEPLPSSDCWDLDGEPSAASRVTFLPRDPQWAYVFWTLSSQDRDRVRAAGQPLCLRVADVTGLPLGSTHPHALQELLVPATACEWYLPVPLCDRDYRVEVGLRLAQGEWLSLAVSSVARVPPLGPSDLVADVFVPFSLAGATGALSSAVESAGVLHEHLYQLASTAQGRPRRSGSEMWHERDSQGEQICLSQASGAGVWASGRNESGSGVQRQRSFWLVADAELIVYGATEPTATLSIGDQPVALDADGRFRIQVPFRDGEQLYPIRAVSADGEQERSIRMEFQRTTPEARVNTREEAELLWF